MASVAVVEGLKAAGGRVGGGRWAAWEGSRIGPSVAGGWLALWGVPAESLALVVEALPWEAEGVRIGRVGEYVKLGCCWL